MVMVNAVGNLQLVVVWRVYWRGTKIEGSAGPTWKVRRMPLMTSQAKTLVVVLNWDSPLP
jgi:hypothetical protein